MLVDDEFIDESEMKNKVRNGPALVFLWMKNGLVEMKPMNHTMTVMPYMTLIKY